MGQSLNKTGGYTEEELLQMISRWVLEERVPKRVRIKETSDFFRVDYDDVVLLGGVPYLVRNNERERREHPPGEPSNFVERGSTN